MASSCQQSTSGESDYTCLYIQDLMKVAVRRNVSESVQWLWKVGVNVKLPLLRNARCRCSRGFYRLFNRSLVAY